MPALQSSLLSPTSSPKQGQIYSEVTSLVSTEQLVGKTLMKVFRCKAIYLNTK